MSWEERLALVWWVWTPAGLFIFDSPYDPLVWVGWIAAALGVTALWLEVDGRFEGVKEWWRKRQSHGGGR